jgi:DNA processing protein
MKINTALPEENEFTKVLVHIAKVPKKLHYLGKLPETRVPTVAIVGTRRPSSYGKEVTYRLSYDLASHGLVIVSGLAIGVDAAAHRAALEAGGTTVAVLGNPLPGISPSSNRALGESIIKSNGAIISEYEENARVFPSNFLERNRLVAGLADAVIITEAAARSGTLNTATHALEQGKELFVVPGPITSPLSAGCNALLKQGAHIVTEYTDVLEIVAPGLLSSQTTMPLGQNRLETAILQAIAGGLRDGDEILKATGADSTEFATALTMLELAGSIRALGANQWTIR